MAWCFAFLMAVAAHQIMRNQVFGDLEKIPILFEPCTVF